ncbi:hypothetical protein [Nonomuraea candida]|uniref:hypothetical protein n=1 Tax=Nonomuraea candida TaxID=359159 RepID=UPI0005BA3BAD|nr:hypothetical protein [Nonomuraea candida]
MSLTGPARPPEAGPATPGPAAKAGAAETGAAKPSRVALAKVATVVTAAAVAVAGWAWLRAHPTPPAPPSLTAASMSLRPVPWEGGPAAYAGWPRAVAAGWTEPAFFPVGLWFATVREREHVTADRAMGVNTYVELTADSRPGLLRGTGMSALTAGGPAAGAAPETVGATLPGKADEWAGIGHARWSGKAGPEQCRPKLSFCGHTVLRTRARELPDGSRPVYATFGKGVAHQATDPAGGMFVNDYADLVGVDVSWYADENVCREAARWRQLPITQCRAAAGYGATVDRIRELDALDGRRKPVFSVISLAGLTPGQVGGAVMSSLIHGARGIVYDAHDPGPRCESANLLRTACGAPVRKAVTELNALIGRLAPVLNTQSYAYDFAPQLDTMLKRHDGAYYLFAMLGRGTATGGHPLTVPANLSPRGRVEDVLTGRPVEVDREGRFTAAFPAEHAYHVYRITP